VTATKAADTNYNSATSTAASVTVQRATQAALIVNVISPSTYNTQQTLTASGGSGTGLVTYSVGVSTACTVSGATLSITGGTGTCSVTATKAADTNYNSATSTAASVTVQPATATISISNLPSNAAYSGNFTPAFSYSGTGSPIELSSSSTTAICSVSGGVVSFIGVGMCTLTASATATANYSAATGSSQSFSVGKATAMVTLGALSQTYLGSALSATATTSPVALTVTFTYGMVRFWTIIAPKYLKTQAYTLI
jgi:hypothetical protein